MRIWMTALLVAGLALGWPSPGAAEPKQDKAEKAAAKGEVKAGKAAAKAEMKAEKAAAKAEMKGERAQHKTEDKAARRAEQAERMPESANPQWKEDATRGQERAKERRGKKGGSGRDEFDDDEDADEEPSEPGEDSSALDPEQDTGFMAGVRRFFGFERSAERRSDRATERHRAEQQNRAATARTGDE